MVLAQVKQKRSAVRDNAPALSRGLALLATLNADGASSLEQLARDAGWPKSSVSRLLGSLEREGLVARDPLTRRYAALARVVRHDEGAPLLRKLAPRALATLAAATRQTTELYELEGTAKSPGLVMIDRCEPENAAVHVRARIGDSRVLDEIEALAQVLYAFSGARPPAKGAWVWREGRQRKIAAREMRRLIDTAAKTGLGQDVGVNANGVFRYAVPLLAEGGRLVAVLAVAQLCTVHGPVPPEERIAQLLRRTGDELQAALAA